MAECRKCPANAQGKTATISDPTPPAADASSSKSKKIGSGLDTSAPDPSRVDSEVLPKVTLNASTLSPNAFYIDLNVSLLSADFLLPSGVLSGFPTLDVGLTLCLSFVQ
jgi:hypothetical protein